MVLEQVVYFGELAAQNLAFVLSIRPVRFGINQQVFSLHQSLLEISALTLRGYQFVALGPQDVSLAIMFLLDLEFFALQSFVLALHALNRHDLKGNDLLESLDFEGLSVLLLFKRAVDLLDLRV